MCCVGLCRLLCNACLGAHRCSRWPGWSQTPRCVSCPCCAGQTWKVVRVTVRVGCGSQPRGQPERAGRICVANALRKQGATFPVPPIRRQQTNNDLHALNMGESCLQLCPSRTSPFPYYGFSWQLNNFRTPRAREPMTGIWKGLVPGPHMRKIRSASSSLISRVFLRHAARAQTNGRSVPSDNLFPARRLGNERLLKRLRGRGAPPVLCAPRAGGTRVSGRHS